jgi:hypothetical protein
MSRWRVCAALDSPIRARMRRRAWACQRADTVLPHIGACCDACSSDLQLVGNIRRDSSRCMTWHCPRLLETRIPGVEVEASFTATVIVVLVLLYGSGVVRGGSAVLLLGGVVVEVLGSGVVVDVVGSGVVVEVVWSSSRGGCLWSSSRRWISVGQPPAECTC